ncbi:hypothetical protein B0H10DRAFT_1950191 [Mycena sp. CBHHK59/15]|nr:hypothetical protein B0H10DRAFT_1950191 [Mycena sp. CBHHK59/15]
MSSRSGGWRAHLDTQSGAGTWVSARGMGRLTWAGEGWGVNGKSQHILSSAPWSRCCTPMFKFLTVLGLASFQLWFLTGALALWVSLVSCSPICICWCCGIRTTKHPPRTNPYVQYCADLYGSNVT